MSLASNPTQASRNVSLLFLVLPFWLTRRPEAESPIWARRCLILLITGLTTRYLLWRFASGLNTESDLALVFSLLLVVAEAWLLLTGLLPLWLSWRRYPDRRNQALQLQEAWQRTAWRPSVDIFVPTCGEPPQVLERTLRGCLGQTYQHTTVWVLDDSGREEIETLALRLGCRYRHRSKRAHAKAGNLNDGLRHSQAELVAVFDADFIPQEHFLERCIGFLQAPDVALVQTPQSFINADPVMRNLALEPWILPDEESFYRWIEPVRDGWGAVVCAGTSFLARRKALIEVGGFNEQALSEDFVTGIALREHGWTLVYLQEKLSAGMAAESMDDFVRQRQRWASGTLQSLWLASGPLRARNLSLGQRLSYLEGVLHWLNTLPRLILVLMPLSVGLLGIVPLQLNSEALIEHLLPLWGTVLLSIGWLNRGSRAALLSELTSWVLTIPLTLTVISGVLGKTLGFHVTPKDRRRDRAGWSWRLTLPLLVLAALNSINLIRVMQTLLIGANPAGSITLVWASLNLVGSLIALRACWDPAVQDPSPWFAVNKRATMETSGGDQAECVLTAISESGAELWFEAPMSSFSTNARLQWTRDMPSLPLTVIATSGSRQLVHWAALNEQQTSALLHWLYQRPGCWPERTPPPEWLALLMVLKRLLAGSPPPRPFRRSLVPLVASNDLPHRPEGPINLTPPAPLRSLVQRTNRSRRTRTITPTLPTPRTQR